MKCFVLFSLMCFASSVPLPNSDTKEETEYVDLTEVRFENGGESVRIQLNAFGREIDLHLKKLPSVFHDELKVINLGNDLDGKTKVQHKTLKNVSPTVYGDEHRRTVVKVSKNEEKAIVEGILSEDLSIHPVLNTTNQKQTHQVIKIRKDLIRKRRNSDNLAFREMENEEDSISTTTVYPLPSLIQPEVFVVVDYKNAQAFAFDEQKIFHYLSIFWHGVNSRFAVAQNPTIQLVIVSVLIIKDVTHQPFIENNRVVFEGQNLIQDEMTLHNVGQHFYSLFNETLFFDLAVLMTGEDLADKTGSGESTEWHPDVKGLADVAGACKINTYYETFDGFAVVEDKMPFFTGVFTHVHEIGHLLGAVHDGEGPQPFLRGHPGARKCPFKDGFLMSYYFGTRNHHYWSQCSMEQFRWKIQDSSGFCLRDEPKKSKIPVSSILPGQKISIRDQCRALVGPEGDIYQDEEKKSPCIHLRCTTNNRTWESSGPALEGSTCDKNKWCINGECVSFESNSNEDETTDYKKKKITAKSRDP